MSRQPRVSDERIRKLVTSGLNDVEIGLKVELTSAAVGERRRKMGLPHNFKGRKRTQPVKTKPEPIKLVIPEPDADGIRHCPPGPIEVHFDLHQFE